MGRSRWKSTASAERPAEFRMRNSASLGQLHLALDDFGPQFRRPLVASLGVEFHHHGDQCGRILGLGRFDFKGELVIATEHAASWTRSRLGNERLRIFGDELPRRSRCCRSRLGTAAETHGRGDFRLQEGPERVDFNATEKPRADLRSSIQCVPAPWRAFSVLTMSVNARRGSSKSPNQTPPSRKTPRGSCSMFGDQQTRISFMVRPQ